MPINIIWYSYLGARLGEQTCSSIGHAFGELQRVGLDAHAYPVGTSHGLYNWQRDREHTLEGFQARLEVIAGKEYEGTNSHAHYTTSQAHP